MNKVRVDLMIDYAKLIILLLASHVIIPVLVLYVTLTLQHHGGRTVWALLVGCKQTFALQVDYQVLCTDQQHRSHLQNAQYHIEYRIFALLSTCPVSIL